QGRERLRPPPPELRAGRGHDGTAGIKSRYVPVLPRIDRGARADHRGRARWGAENVTDPRLTLWSGRTGSLLLIHTRCAPPRWRSSDQAVARLRPLRPRGRT